MVTKRLICNIDESLFARVDEYARRMSISRTAAVAVLLSRGLEVEQKTAPDLNGPTPS